MKTHLNNNTTCTNVSTCTHPDHVDDGETTCEERAVGCSSKCPCCYTIPTNIAFASIDEEDSQ